MNPNQPTRPFLRLFSPMPSDPAETAAAETLPAECSSEPRPGDARAAALQGGQTACQLDRIAGVAPVKRVEVSLGEIAPVLADAITQQRGWLSDFASDTVSIDADLYEVLLAYQKMRQLNAA